MFRPHYKKIDALLGLLLVGVLAFAPLAVALADDSSTPPADSTPPAADTSDSTPAPDSSTPPADATTPDASAPAPSDPSVTTGDADSTADTSNTVNTNDTDVPQDASSAVTDDNTASTTNDTTATADTGSNSTSGGGSASVTTGDAIAVSNVINVVNTNLVNSSGMLAFFNALFGNSVNLDTPDINALFNPGSANNSNCSLSSCDSGSLSVSNSNDATVTNTVLSVASTGGNSASSTEDASISTGNAAAAVNVVNVVNTNLVNSHYLLLALNNFGSMSGDITLPGADFFTQLLQGGSLSGGSSVTNTNTATVTNTTSADASTGDNSASSTGDASVTTGNAVAGATTVNQVNTNLTGGSTVYILVNIIGNWSGTVQGLPPGMSWVQTPTGIMLLGGDVDALAGGTPSTSGNPASDALSSLMAQNTNTATVTNNVQAYALTGSNEADSSGADGSASVSTGNAYASANVVNVVNSNIIGQNWMLAIFNIFGNWSGNLAFGEPDLWIGGVAQGNSPAGAGDPVTYTFTVTNHGDADATNVVLNAAFDPSLLQFSDGSTTPGGDSWNLGDIPAGATETFTYDAIAGAVSGTVAAPLAATVTSDETDANMADNTENITVMLGTSLYTPGTAIGQYTDSPKLSITKTESVSSTQASSSVDYKVVVENDPNAGPAYNEVLTDNLTDPSGKNIYNNSWNLDTIEPGDQITLTYSIEYGTSSIPGIYTDVSTVTGLKNYDTMPYANLLDPLSATSTLTLTAGQVLGAETDTPSSVFACGPLLTSYLQPIGNSDPAQVKLLQYFLHTFEGANVQQSGAYDASTIAAVQDFQQKYATDVLSPWGLSDPSGSVFYTTEKKINELYCQGRSQFPLSDEQTKQILTYKQRAGGWAQAPQTKSFDIINTATPWAGANVHATGGSNLENNGGVFGLLHSLLGNFVSVLDAPNAQAAGY